MRKISTLRRQIQDTLLLRTLQGEGRIPFLLISFPLLGNDTKLSQERCRAVVTTKRKCTDERRVTSKRHIAFSMSGSCYENARPLLLATLYFMSLLFFPQYLAYLPVWKLERGNYHPRSRCGSPNVAALYLFWVRC